MNTSPDQKETLRFIGDHIRYYRVKRGWSQEQLAFESDLHRTYIGAVERGERNITVLNLLKIKDTLHVQLTDLYPEG